MLFLVRAGLAAQRAFRTVFDAQQAVDAAGLTDAARDRVAALVAVKVHYIRAPSRGTPTKSVKMPIAAMMVYGVIGIS